MYHITALDYFIGILKLEPDDLKIIKMFSREKRFILENQTRKENG